MFESIDEFVEAFGEEKVLKMLRQWHEYDRVLARQKEISALTERQGISRQEAKRAFIQAAESYETG